jgi:hypothetical protein
MAAAKLYHPDSPTPFALSRSKVEMALVADLGSTLTPI